MLTQAHLWAEERQQSLAIPDCSRVFDLCVPVSAKYSHFRCLSMTSVSAGMKQSCPFSKAFPVRISLIELSTQLFCRLLGSKSLEVSSFSLSCSEIVVIIGRVPSHACLTSPQQYFGVGYHRNDAWRSKIICLEVGWLAEHDSDRNPSLILCLGDVPPLIDSQAGPRSQ